MDTKTRQYENFLRGQISQIATDKFFEKINPTATLQETTQKRFGSENKSALSFLHSAQDILGDSEYTILEFEKYKDLKKDRSIGEMYLSIYGVLSASWLQIQALETLYEVFNISNKTSAIKKLKSLNINVLRNRIAAHALNCIENGTIESFRLVRMSVTHPEALQILGNHGNSSTYNLYECIEEFKSLKEAVLEEIITKIINKIHKNSTKETRNKLLEKLNEITLGKIKTSTF